jgi:hypothetical protein
MTKEQMDEQVGQVSEAALALVMKVEGNIEFARSLWNDAFEEAVDDIQAINMAMTGG